MSEFKFDEEKHEFTLDGKKLISVTQLLRKHGISRDYANVDAEVMRKASERGTLIHREVQEWVETGNGGFTEEAYNIIKWLDYQRDFGNVRISSEVKLHDDLIAGIADLIIESDYKDITIADIKTGNTKDLYCWSWQLALYAYLYSKQEGKSYADIKTVVLWTKEQGEYPVLKTYTITLEQVENLLKCEKDGEKFIYAPAVNADALSEFYETKKEIERLKARIKELEEQIEPTAAEIEKSLLDKGLKTVEYLDSRITYVYPTERISLDTKKLEEENKDIYNKYLRKTPVKGSLKINFQNKER